MSWLLFVFLGIILLSFLSRILQRFIVLRANKKIKKKNKVDLNAAFETNKTIWQHSIQKVIAVPYYEYQEVFDVFPYFSNYQESDSYLRNHNVSNHFRNQFLTNMQQYEGEIFQFWNEQQQKILRSFDETGLGISPELAQFFLSYYNFFLEAFRNDIIIYLINQILVAEMGRAMNEMPQKVINSLSYNDFIQNSKENFFATCATEVDQIIKNLYNDIATQYTQFFQQQNHNNQEQQQKRAYQEQFFQQEFDEINRAYRLLEADENTQDDTIKKNYRRLAKQYHPDCNSSEEAKIKMSQINAAYDLIKKIRNL